MSRGNDARFQRRLERALRPSGWRRSGQSPVVTMPSAGTFVRPLANGWVAVLTARSYGRDETEQAVWLPGSHGAVAIEGWATYRERGTETPTDGDPGAEAATDGPVPGGEDPPPAASDGAATDPGRQ